MSESVYGKEEDICPKCGEYMKEFITRKRCRNLECRFEKKVKEKAFSEYKISDEFQMKHLLYPQYNIHIPDFYDLINENSEKLSEEAKKLLEKYEQKGRKGVCESVLRHWKYVASLGK